MVASAETVAGRATHQVEGGPEGLDETAYSRLVLDAGVRGAPGVAALHAGIAEVHEKAFGTDSSRMRHQLLAHNVIEGDDSRTNASPAVSDGRIFLRTDRRLYCIEEGAGAGDGVVVALARVARC